MREEVQIDGAAHGLPVRGESSVRDLWWSLIDHQIGVIPLPVFVLLIGVIEALSYSGKVPADILTNIAVLAVGGFACAEIGKHLPFLKQLGAAAILATFIPSYLVYAQLVPEPVIASVTTFTKSSNILYLFIAAIIVGSILGMDRRVLISGFLKIVVPIAIGSIAAALVGTGVGWALGLGARHSFFYLVIPVMAGGVGEGAIPLSVGYDAVLHRTDLLAVVLPPVMLGSLFAILIAGALNFLGQRYPALTGDGRLQPGEQDEMLDADPQVRAAPGIDHVAGAAVTVVAFYLIGVLAQRYWGWPAPVVMLFAVVIAKLLQLASPRLEQGTFIVYRFFAVGVTYPLLFAIGVAMTPWDKLIASLAWANLVTIFAVVATMIASGFATARLLGMYPVEAAIVCASRCSQGGTGDVAMLTAANRLQLMPFVQIGTRIGGALTVVLALIAFAHFGV